MSVSSRKRAEDFLELSSQFRLGALTTESSHPITANLSEVASVSISAALKLLFDVDSDVIKTYRTFVESGRANQLAASILHALERGGKIFFTGCGSTGRLSIQLVSIWRDFWQRQRAQGLACRPKPQVFEDRAVSVMAGGDFALIKAVEGFEDFSAFGKKQINDLGLCSKDVVFAITEGGETSFVIGTAWQGVEAGAKVHFIYNNPDEMLCRTVQRSREIINEPRIEKINLTTGPMAITGSTRMQATTIQLCVLVTVMEMAVRELMHKLDPGGQYDLPSEDVPSAFLANLEAMHLNLTAPRTLDQLSALVSLEENAYRTGHKINYFADRFGIDVLTDTTERSPTYCTPAFRKFDDPNASESWAFLFVPHETTAQAWEKLLKRTPNCIEWKENAIRELVETEKFQRTVDIVRKIGPSELMRFKVGMDGLAYRPVTTNDGAIAIISTEEKYSVLTAEGFYRGQLQRARNAGGKPALLCLGSAELFEEIRRSIDSWAPDCLSLFVPAPKTHFLLDGVTRVGLKMLLNAISTCTMVRLGRVMGNLMIWVVPSNLKLIDRATRYIEKLTGLGYEAANHLLFEVIEFIEPRMRADEAYPPAVALAVLRARHGISNEQAEKQLTFRTVKPSS